jgi:hypothetical protein
MKNAILDKLVEEWMSSDSFRSEFRANPEAAAHKRGILLDAETLAVVQTLGSSSAHSLEPRINMDPPTNGC